MNNKLIIYKNNIFSKIMNFLKKYFSKNKEKENESREEYIKENARENSNEKNTFEECIKIIEDKEFKRLKMIQLQYENGEIDEEELSEEEIEKICEMYKKETEELNADTERRKKHIAQMLKELKNY